MRQILVVDNDLAVCQTIQGRLQNDVTEVCCISSLVEALSSYIRQDYCLAILDTQLSDCDTAETLRVMRSSKHTPILLLTNPLPPTEVVEFLHAGADTYLEKPLNMDICVAQANALIKRYNEEDINHNEHKPVVHGSEFMISPRYRQAMIDGKPLTLTRTSIYLRTII